jgi:thiamine-phosphate pyrophosphorylase
LPDCGGIFEKRRFEPPIWYGISNRRFFPDLSLETYVRLLLETSADVVQLREKDLDRRELLELAAIGSSVACQSQKIFLFNGDVEVALESGAAGVHLPGGGNVREAREKARGSGRADFLVGLSVHSIEEAVSTAGEGVDYLLLGPVFPPISKQGRAPLGLRLLGEACRTLKVPVIALGGITRQNYASVLETGAAGIAGISWIAEEIQMRLKSRT